MEAVDTVALVVKQVVLEVGMGVKSMAMVVVSAAKIQSYATSQHKDVEMNSKNTMLATMRRFRLRQHPKEQRSHPAQVRSRRLPSPRHQNRKLQSRICSILAMNPCQPPDPRTEAPRLRLRTL